LAEVGLNNDIAWHNSRAASCQADSPDDRGGHVEDLDRADGNAVETGSKWIKVFFTGMDGRCRAAAQKPTEDNGAITAVRT